jgi:hypothetical protein
MARKQYVILNINDEDFEFQIKLESPVYSGTRIVLYLMRKSSDTDDYIENPDSQSSVQEEKLHWATYEVNTNLERNDVITLKINVSTLYDTDGLIGKYLGQIALYDPDAQKRLETIQPVYFKTVYKTKV